MSGHPDPLAAALEKLGGFVSDLSAVGHPGGVISRLSEEMYEVIGDALAIRLEEVRQGRQLMELGAGLRSDVMSALAEADEIPSSVTRWDDALSTAAAAWPGVR